MEEKENVNVNLQNEVKENSASDVSAEKKEVKGRPYYKRNFNGRNRGNYGGSSNSDGGYYKRGNNGFMRRKRKVCEFCAEGLYDVDYKDTVRLSKFLSEKSKIVSRRAAGTCAGHQRKLALALKRARYMALLPYCKG